MQGQLVDGSKRSSGELSMKDLVGRRDAAIVAVLQGLKVRQAPSWPTSWANFSLLQLYSHRNAWTNSHLVASLTLFSLQANERPVSFKLGRICRFCNTAHPPYTRFANILGASISEATMRPSPRLYAINLYNSHRLYVIYGDYYRDL
jgi:hypothetical protein